SEERDRTPNSGKFWVYERGIGIVYYAIYEVKPGRVEVYRLQGGRYRRVRANRRGHYPISPLGIELGIWRGVYQHQDLPWLRAWDSRGRLLPSAEERAEAERLRAEAAEEQVEQAQQQIEQAQERTERLAAQLRALGIDPDAVP